GAGGFPLASDEDLDGFDNRCRRRLHRGHRVAPLNAEIVFRVAASSRTCGLVGKAALLFRPHRGKARLLFLRAKKPTSKAAGGYALEPGAHAFYSAQAGAYSSPWLNRHACPEQNPGYYQDVGQYNTVLSAPYRQESAMPRL